ncbi:MAG: GNAT family N-acetyltransferase [Deltaproteobacteria bacterium]|nr:GNAT family N-acetyltransferase [Deltaproteobacteria bacterium]
MDLRASGLRIRPLVAADAEPYGRLLADPRVHPYVVEDGPVAPAEIPARIARAVERRADGTGAMWAVTYEDRFVGYVALHGLGQPKVAISYATATADQRRGFARRAIWAVLARGNAHGFEEVEARTHLDNQASAAVLSAVGFVEQEPSVSPARRVFLWRASAAVAAARAFAAALDIGDWNGVRELLDPACVYDCRGATTIGPETIVASYAEIDTWVHETFEDVAYESTVEGRTPSQALITFRDQMSHGVHRLDFRCQQRIEIDASGRLVRIDHIDLPGEREKADRFNEACGVRRP